MQHRQQVFGTGLVAALGNVERGLRLAQFFALPLALFVEAANAAQGFFHVSEAIDDRPSIGFQQFVLTRLGLVALGAQAAVVEDRRGQSGRQVVERGAQQIRRQIGASAEAGGQGDFRQHGGAGHADVSLGRRQFGFGAGDVRTPAQQIAGHTTGDVRPLQLFE
ncbi:hypothetical protein D3C78_1293670 [compost metagenome]